MPGPTTDTKDGNLYSQLLKTDSDDQDLSRHVDEVRGSLDRLNDDTSLVGGPYKLGSVNKKLMWFAGDYSGTAAIHKQGAGIFKSKSKDPITTGRNDNPDLKSKFKVVFGAGEFKLEFFDENGKSMYYYDGTGVQRGLTGTWTGDWKKSDTIPGETS